MELSYPSPLKRYLEFAHQRKIPVFIILGLELWFEEVRWTIRILYVQYPPRICEVPALFERIFTKYERDYDKPFFWKKGKLL